MHQRNGMDSFYSGQKYDLFYVELKSLLLPNAPASSYFNFKNVEEIL